MVHGVWGGKSAVVSKNNITGATGSDVADMILNIGAATQASATAGYTVNVSYG